MAEHAWVKAGILLRRAPLEGHCWAWVCEHCKAEVSSLNETGPTMSDLELDKVHPACFPIAKADDSDDLRSYWADVVPDLPASPPAEPTCDICGLTQSRYAKQRIEGGHEKNWPENGFLEAQSGYTTKVIRLCSWCNMHLAEHYETVLEPRFRKRYVTRLKEIVDKIELGAADIRSLLGNLQEPEPKNKPEDGT